jgi:asparagine synthase (glutamine-hydrolysing)
MGAIVGILEKKQLDSKILKQMQNLLSYRGCVDNGEFFQFKKNFFQYGGVVGKLYSDSNIIVSIDGKIYNTDELSAYLKNSDLKNIEYSDLDLFLQLYLQFGFKKALQLIDGAFAICLVDLNKKIVYIARDRMGIKPIYYYNRNDILLFASGYKTFYFHPHFKAELNHDAVSEYFIFRYPAGERTFLKDVYLIKPGSYIEVHNKNIKEHKYWKLPSYTPNDLSFDDNKQTLKEYILKSIKRRLKDHKPIGIQLSGGVDSSYVASIMREQMGGDIKSYSVVMEDLSISEEQYIDVVNRTQNLSSHKLLLDADVFFKNWEKSTWFYESPLQHEGNVPLLQLNNEASKEVSILMCGDGADESMGGYNRFATIMRYHNIKQKIYWYRSQLINLIKGRKYYKSLSEYFISLSQFLSDNEIEKLRPNTYKKDIKRVYKYRKKIMSACHNSCLHRYLEYEMSTYLLDTLLRGDKIASASNLEMRAPFLMHELIEFLQTVPEKFFVDSDKPQNFNTKILLKSICSDVYGEEFTYRNKVGLGIPMHTILNDKKICKYIENQLLPGIRLRKVVNYEYVKSVWEQVEDFKSNADARIQVLWLAFSFEIWAQMYLDGNPTKYICH